ncbi:MAG: sulfite exporter TauE/SafE family protein [Saprospirales bacterium]|nr:sulfite exporter TauE/SafE family protein [Saprospirales bacterium]MBK8489752.1 sulfite exporter TauE/SafE family protein [Saprospirales bacterium]
MGLLGSLHCVGMCGPIALSLPYQGAGRLAAIGNALLYNLGRTATYVMIGSLFGLLGKGIFLAGYQSALSISMGVLMLILAFFSTNLESRVARLPLLQGPLLRLKSALGNLIRARSRSSFFSIGLLNGLLPCGLVYMAVVGAVSTGSVWKGAAYMGLFGLGTIPLMLLTALAGNWIGVKLRRRVRAVLPFMLVLIAALLIFRGLNFDLPRGLELWEDASNVPMCH